MEHETILTKAESTNKINSCVKLFKSLWLNESQDKNFAFSPFSIFALLGILASGSSGATLKQVLRFLNYENLDELNRVCTRLMDELIQTENGVNEEAPDLIKQPIQKETSRVIQKETGVDEEEDPELPFDDEEYPKLFFEEASGFIIDEPFQIETPRKKRKVIVQTGVDEDPELSSDEEEDPELSIGSSVKGEGPKLSFVSGIWVTDKYGLNPVFKETVSASYKAEAESVDFTESEVARLKVNKWVEGKTNGLIQDLLPDGSIKSSTVIIAANALYFKGSWEPDQFIPELTKEKPFYLLGGESVEVPSMYTSRGYLCVSCYKDFKVLKLPYRALEVEAENKEKRHKLDKSSTDDQCFAMYIVLPNTRDGLGEVIQTVSSDAAGFLGSYLPTDYVSVDDFMLPKFKILFNFTVTRVLNELGVKLAFDEKAEITEMLADSEGSVCISEVIHKCSVEVDEQGTEAAASSAMCEDEFICFDDSPPPRGIDFVADHPFMFMIREEKSGVVLFMGHVLNPLLDS